MLYSGSWKYRISTVTITLLSELLRNKMNTGKTYYKYIIYVNHVGTEENILLVKGFEIKTSDQLEF